MSVTESCSQQTFSSVWGDSSSVLLSNLTTKKVCGARFVRDLFTCNFLVRCKQDRVVRGYLVTKNGLGTDNTWLSQVLKVGNAVSQLGFRCNNFRTPCWSCILWIIIFEFINSYVRFWSFLTTMLGECSLKKLRFGSTLRFGKSWVVIREKKSGRWIKTLRTPP